MTPLPTGLGLTPGGDFTRAMAAHWWMLAVRGVIAILFGVMAFIAPVAVMLSMAVLFGVYLIVDGIVGLISAFRTQHSDQRWWLLLAEAVLNLAMGALALFFPGGAVVAFIVVTAIWALMTGGFLIAAAFRMHTHGRLWLGIGGAISILWGALLIAAPLAGAVVLTWWLGGYAVLFGVVLLVAAWRLRGMRPDAPATPNVR